MNISVVNVAADASQLWDEYAGRAASATLYHLYGWRRVVEDTFGHRTHYLAARGADGVLGVLPLVELRSRLFGHMLVSMPFFNYGGICADGEPARQALLHAGIELAETRRADFVEIRHDDDWESGLPTKTAKVSMRLTLPGSPEELWKSFPSKLRSQVDRPRKAGMTATLGGRELLDAFYEVFSTNMRDLGTPVYPKSFFRAILDAFPDRTWVGAVHLEGKPVAAGFLAGFRDRLEIPWASSVRAYNRSSPNMLLYWTCLEFASRSGYRVFDFGRSTPGEGTYRFKAQWGAVAHPLHWHYWLRNGGALPQVNPKNPKYQLAIELWKRLPLGVTRQIGPRIVKYIP